MQHTFNGGNAALVASIRALLSLNEAKAVSHPVPGMAVQLLSVAADRLAAPTPAVAVPVSEADRAWLLRTIEREKYTGHCGEENAEIMARHAHNERCDRLLEALAVPDKGVQGDQGDMAARAPQNDQCGSQPGADVNATAALARGPDDCWSVSVTFNGENILTIEQGVNYGSLSGIPNIEEFGDIVRDAALHLRSFIGSGGPNPCFLCGETEGCECWSQDTQLEPRDGATASTTSASGNEQVAAVVVQPIREAIDPSAPASTVRGE